MKYFMKHVKLVELWERCKSSFYREEEDIPYVGFIFPDGQITVMDVLGIDQEFIDNLIKPDKESN